MPKLTIDNREVEVEAGATVLDAAQKLGLTIPTMCHLRGHDATTSCMVCVVKVGVAGVPPARGEGVSPSERVQDARDTRDVLVPACGTVVRDGMRVESESAEVRDARQAALELLLSDHVGDCVGPCRMACPARMDIPLMIHQVAAGDLRAAITTVKRDIALPAVLGRICPAPCEKACRRRSHDEAVSICLLKRFVADADLQSASPYIPKYADKRGKRVAIIGAGPAGLAAAYYLQQDGFECTVFDEHDEPGGMLRYGVPEENLPRDVLAAEIAQIQRLGVEFRLGTRVGVAVPMDEIRWRYDAVFLSTGEWKPDEAGRGEGVSPARDEGILPSFEAFGVAASAEGIIVDGQTHATSVPGMFAGGDAIRKRRLAVRAVADGKEAAESIRQYLTGAPVVGPARAFNSRMGQLEEGEIGLFLQSANPAARCKPSEESGGFTPEEARTESLRCLRCDCRKADACLLRQHAGVYDARQARYKAQRRRFVQQTQHPDVIYEPGKCIDCGICIQIASAAKEKLGLAFVGRGFDVRVAVPFNESLTEGLRVTAAQCVAACPTGALAFKDTRP